jgi:hemoglobin
MPHVTIFEAAGGSDAFLRLATAHNQRCLEDPVLNHPFSHPGHPRHIERLAAYWAEVFGGPPEYTRTAGDHSTMLELHSRTGAQADLGELFLACFIAALDDAELPTDPDLRSAMRAYMVWATSEVMTYAPADAVVPTCMPVPCWGWHGLRSRDTGQ